MLGTDTEIERASVIETPASETGDNSVSGIIPMKVNSSTKLALKKAAIAHAAPATAAVKLRTKKDATKAEVKAKGKKAKKVKEAAKRADYKGIVGKVVLHILGAKGSVLRLANIDKLGFAKLAQNNVGLSYDGPSIDLFATDKADKGTRLHAGYYVCERGARPEVKVLTADGAKSLCRSKVTVERNGKKVQLRVGGDLKDHYLPSYEVGPKGDWFFQLETSRLPQNKKHFGALVKVGK